MKGAAAAKVILDVTAAVSMLEQVMTGSLLILITM